jgi:TonB family C-terminal domain
MEIKKSPKADLENKRSLFLQIGFVVAIGIALVAFEFDFGEAKESKSFATKAVAAEEEIVPITQEEQPQEQEVAPQQIVSDVLNIVRNDVKVSNELNIFDQDDRSAAPIVIPTVSKKEEPIDEEEIFYIIEDMPTFNGKEAAVGFREYVGKNLKYPDVAAENGIQGTVYVSFVVEPTGLVSNVKVIRGVDASLDREATRIVQNSPKWTPGKQRGKSVRVSFTFPIKFQLN